MNRAQTLLGAAAVAWGAWGTEAPAGAWRIVPAGQDAPLAVSLPPLARVVSEGPGGRMWQQTGELGGSVASVRGDFMLALSAQGWALNKTIVLGRSPAGSELMLWTWRKRRILFMVWEKEAGTCGFAWGEEK